MAISKLNHSRNDTHSECESQQTKMNRKKKQTSADPSTTTATN